MLVDLLYYVDSDLYDLCLCSDSLDLKDYEDCCSLWCGYSTSIASSKN